MVSSQECSNERVQSRTRKVHQINSLDMLAVVMDLLMKKLEDLAIDHLKMVDARMTCEACREIGQLGDNFPETVGFLT